LYSAGTAHANIRFGKVAAYAPPPYKDEERERTTSNICAGTQDIGKTEEKIKKGKRGDGDEILC